MIRIEVGYTDEDGKVNTEVIDAKSIDFVRITDDGSEQMVRLNEKSIDHIIRIADDGSKQIAFLDGDTFYDLCFVESGRVWRRLWSDRRNRIHHER